MNIQRKNIICFLLINILVLVLIVSCYENKKDNNNIEYGTVKDTDGTTYKTVKIGEQYWMAENLKYLPEVHNNREFANKGINNAPGYGVYGYNGSDASKAETLEFYDNYGVLYNWYAVEAGNLCPSGWHVPSDEDWVELTNYLAANGHHGRKGVALKATSGWAQDRNGTDDYGFSALPGGFRGNSGEFKSFISEGYFWSSSDHRNIFGWFRGIYFNRNGVHRYSLNKEMGLSIRCIKNN